MAANRTILIRGGYYTTSAGTTCLTNIRTILAVEPTLSYTILVVKTYQLTNYWTGSDMAPSRP